MKSISTERKQAILAKMSGPNRPSIRALAREEGISEATLYNWRKQARLAGAVMPAHDNAPAGWSTRDKFNAVLETARLSEAEVSEYCRRNGLYPQQIQHWREACERANDWDDVQKLESARRRKEDAKAIRDLQRDLQRKEKALAEAAALLVLKKKVHQIWGDEDE